MASAGIACLDVAFISDLPRGRGCGLRAVVYHKTREHAQGDQPSRGCRSHRVIGSQRREQRGRPESVVHGWQCGAQAAERVPPPLPEHLDRGQDATRRPVASGISYTLGPVRRLDSDQILFAVLLIGSGLAGYGLAESVHLAGIEGTHSMGLILPLSASGFVPTCASSRS